MAKTVNKAELADYFEVSERTLTNWQDDGMPILSVGDRGESNAYNVRACINWWIAREVGKHGEETPRDRLARVQADRIEMEIAEKRRELIPAAEIGQQWASVVIASRQAMLVIPQNIAPLLVGMDDPDPIRELLQDAIEEALARLAEDDQPDALPNPDDGDGPLGPATADASLGVGGEEPGNAGWEPDTGPVPICADTISA